MHANQNFENVFYSFLPIIIEIMCAKFRENQTMDSSI